MARMSFRMTRRSSLVGAAACAAIGAQSRSGPVLVRAIAAFHTTDDDKDWDTLLSVYVTRGRDVIARIESVQGHYSDNSDNPVELQVLAQATREEFQQGCSVTVSIRPNGHDTWKCNLDLRLIFADGNIWTRGFQNIRLDQDNREFRATW